MRSCSTEGRAVSHWPLWELAVQSPVGKRGLCWLGRATETLQHMAGYAGASRTNSCLAKNISTENKDWKSEHADYSVLPVVSTIPSRMTTISNCSLLSDRCEREKKGLSELISWQMVKGETKNSWSAPVPNPTSSSHWSSGRNSPSGVCLD